MSDKEFDYKDYGEKEIMELLLNSKRMKELMGTGEALKYPLPPEQKQVKIRDLIIDLMNSLKQQGVSSDLAFEGALEIYKMETQWR